MASSSIRIQAPSLRIPLVKEEGRSKNRLQGGEGLLCECCLANLKGSSNFLFMAKSSSPSRLKARINRNSSIIRPLSHCERHPFGLSRKQTGWQTDEGSWSVPVSALFKQRFPSLQLCRISLPLPASDVTCRTFLHSVSCIVLNLASAAMDVDKPTTSQTGELPAPSSISGSNPPDVCCPSSHSFLSVLCQYLLTMQVRLPEGDPAKSSSHSPTSARQAFPTPTSTNETVIPTTTVRRASITFKLKNYNDGLEKAAVHSTSDMLGPNWAGARLSRASSPALSVQSESSDRGSAIKNNGTRPATFLFTLTTFLRENPKSPYMR